MRRVLPALVMLIGLGFAVSPDASAAPVEDCVVAFDSGPCVSLSDTSVKVGSIVTFRATIPPQHADAWEKWWQPGGSIAMFRRPLQADGSRCYYRVSNEPSYFKFHHRTKVVTGGFTVGAIGACDGGPTSQVQAGRYWLVTCRHCGFAAINVEPRALARTGVPALVPMGLLGVSHLMVGAALLGGSRCRARWLRGRS